MARQDKFRIVWLRDGLVFCARKAKGHSEYLIRIFVTQSVHGDPQVVMRCDFATGGKCKWTEFHEGEPCAHICAVLLRAQKKKFKQQQKAEAA